MQSGEKVLFPFEYLVSSSVDVSDDNLLLPIVLCNALCADRMQSSFSSSVSKQSLSGSLSLDFSNEISFLIMALSSSRIKSLFRIANSTLRLFSRDLFAATLFRFRLFQYFWSLSLSGVILFVFLLETNVVTEVSKEVSISRGMSSAIYHWCERSSLWVSDISLVASQFS